VHLGPFGVLTLALALFGNPKPNGPGPAEGRDGPNAVQAEDQGNAKAKPADKNAKKNGEKKKKPSARVPVFGPDGSRVPSMGHPTLHTRSRPPKPMLSGWAAELQSPRFIDHRRRQARVPLPANFGSTLRVGERLAFDVEFAGNPAGSVEASVVARERAPGGGASAGLDRVRIESKAVTSGVVSMLTEITVRMTSWLDQETGASVHNIYQDDRKGLGAKFAHRKMELSFEGRGGVRVTDTVDGRIRRMKHDAPDDALDVLSAMAWVRSLALAEGERASAHVIDGKILLRLEVVSRGAKPLDPYPSLATALNVAPTDLHMLEGTLTRVDNHDDPVPGKRSYQFRAWVSTDDRHLVLRLESDMWLGIIRLTLVGYDPPHSE
jgi:hypothetical protein